MISTDKFHNPKALLFYSFCLLFFLLPLAKSPPLIACGIVLLIWVFSGTFIKDFKLWFRQNWIPPVILFIILHWIGLLWSNDLEKGLTFAEKTYYWLFAFAITSIPFAKTVYFILAFICGLSINVIIAILQYLGIVPYLQEGVATGFLTGMNPYISYSLILVLGMMILSFYFSKIDKKWQKIFLIILIAAYIFNLSIIYGRSGYIAFIVLSPFLIYNLVGKKHFIKSLIVAVILAGLFLLSPTVQHRLTLIKEEIRLYYQGHKNTSVGLRLHMWDGAIKVFKENPLIGVGTGGYEGALKKICPDPSLSGLDQPHNSFLYMATSYGVIGILSILWLFVVFLKKGWKNRENIQGYSMLMFGIILIIGSMTDTQIISRITGILFALFMGMRVNEDER